MTAGLILVPTLVPDMIAVPILVPIRAPNVVADKPRNRSR